MLYIAALAPGFLNAPFAGGLPVHSKLLPLQTSPPLSSSSLQVNSHVPSLHPPIPSPASTVAQPSRLHQQSHSLLQGLRKGGAKRYRKILHDNIQGKWHRRRLEKTALDVVYILNVFLSCMVSVLDGGSLALVWFSITFLNTSALSMKLAFMLVDTSALLLLNNKT
ncbi:hypothetical protein BT96DRAFT_1009487 [Gymnopus androsaceus JB14]|uniref:Uncharacterized protein n=1 Tax=Gymnopus androsaceus JB14 TaxID=1447944 RepID=A0A6A4GCU9_9AGAR|nr:hypothetical protein BT96DRAFT_1009487 [Gymnopus androsaceus JB14]